MIKLFDRVKVNVPTTGTGDITFGAAASTAFLTPTEAGVLDGDEVRYVIVDGLGFEEGVGLIKDTVATMERTVTKSKVGGVVGTSALNLSGTAVLALTASAADILTPDDNLASLVDADAALDNLGGTTAGKAIFKAATKADVITNVTGDVLRITDNYSVTAADNGKVIMTEKAGSCLISLPPAASVTGMRIIVKNFSTTNTIIDPNESETIDGAVSKVLRFSGQSAAIVSALGSWYVLDEGSIFQRGANWIRFANGIQQCWEFSPGSYTTSTADGSGWYISNYHEFNFPVAFSTLPYCTPIANKSHGGSGLVTAVIGNDYPTPTGVRIFMLSNSAAGNAVAGYSAVGVWF